MSLERCKLQLIHTIKKSGFKMNQIKPQWKEFKNFSIDLPYKV